MPLMVMIVTADEFGGPEVLRLVDVELPAPGPGEVALAVRAAGVNPADSKLRAGYFGGQPPLRFGSEAAGIVTAVGEDVTAVSVGDEVIAYPTRGAYAGALVVPESAVLPKPATLGWDEAAGLLLTGATATHAVQAAGIGAGDVVLIHGAAGGVGQMAVQLAAFRGARVIGTASAGNAGLIRELGGDPVEYGEGLADRVRALAPGGVDAALDLVGTDEALAVSLELVNDRARIASIVPRPAVFGAGVKVLGGAPGADPGTELRRAARSELTELAAQGRLRVRVAHTFPLTEAAQAHRLIDGGHANGKIVLRA